MATTHDGAPRGGSWLLWGLENRRLDLALTVLAVAVLVLSRFGLLASGPWEWDETIFARGMLKFELAAHFPQPPGFPGLLALGHLLWPLAGTPYQALQWLSASASVLALWPLSLIGRKVAAPAVATAAALLVLSLPGPWLYSVRGFSTWPAVALALAATAVWAGGLEGRRVTAFTLLLTAAFLVRPILLPTLALLWLMGIRSVSPPKRMLPGIASGVALVAVAVVVMVQLEGGWAAFIRPFVVHADFHTARLHRNLPGIENLGLVNGVGGAVTAALLLGGVLAGVVAWWRRSGWRPAAAWVLVLGLTTAQLYALQNRSYARYAVGVQVATAPLLAGAAAIAPPGIAAVGMLGLAGLAAWRSLPLLEEQHRESFGAWQATVEAARIAGERSWAVVVEPEVHVFSSYWWHVLEDRGEPVPPMVLTPRAPEAWLGVARPYLVATVHPHLYLPSLTGESRRFGRVSQRLEPLTQNRFLAAEVISNPPLPVGQWWTREHLPDGTPFMWAGPDAELWLPPVPLGTLVGLAIRPAPGDTPLHISLATGGFEAELDGLSGEARLWHRLESDASAGPVVVRLRRASGYPPGNGDERPLAAQLLDVVVRPPGTAFGGPVASDRDRWRLRLHIDGAHAPESFADIGTGVWLEPSARLRLDLDEPGSLVLKMAAPRPTPANLRLVVEGRSTEDTTALASIAAEIPVELSSEDVSDGRVEIVVSSDRFVPADVGTSSDSRPLGVVLLGLDFRPKHPTTGWWAAAP